MTQMACFGPDYRLGVLGGGQLGRMMIQAAVDLDVRIEVLDGSADAPCKDLTRRFVHGDVRDADVVEAFGLGLDALTIEMEDVSVEGMRRLKARGVRVVPDPEHVALIQDKGLQKEFFVARGIPTSAFALQQADDVGARGFPIVQKVRRGGYDGKGVVVLRDAADAQSRAFREGECLLEDCVEIELELSVVVVRRSQAECASYAPVESVFDQRANVLSYLVSPAKVSPELDAAAEALARRVADELDFVGVLAVELFVEKGTGALLVNEIAPRVHNSGHHTIEANATSQFAQLVRVAIDLPVGSVTATRAAAATLNVLGSADARGAPLYCGLGEALATPGVYPHLYGKSSVTPFRKMGHLTIVGDDRDHVVRTTLALLESIAVDAKPAN